MSSPKSPQTQILGERHDVGKQMHARTAPQGELPTWNRKRPDAQSDRQSLQKGAISGAQRALSPLQQTQQAQQTEVGGRHHHGDHGGGSINSGTSANTLTSSTDNSPTAGTTVDIAA
jgi:hypothetical protein